MCRLLMEKACFVGIPHVTCMRLLIWKIAEKWIALATWRIPDKVGIPRIKGFSCHIERRESSSKPVLRKPGWLDLLHKGDTYQIIRFPNYGKLI